MADQAAQNLLRTEYEAAITTDPLTEVEVETAEDKSGEVLTNMRNGDPAPNNGALTVSDDGSRGVFNLARLVNYEGDL